MDSQSAENQAVSTSAIIVGQATESRPDVADIKRQLVEWLAMPEEFRKPGNLKSFAAKFGLHRCTVSQWKAEPQVQAAVISLVRENAYEGLADVVQALKAAALEGNVLAQKLFFQWVTGWSEKIEHTGVVENRVVHVGFGDEATQPWFAKNKASVPPAGVN